MLKDLTIQPMSGCMALWVHRALTMWRARWTTWATSWRTSRPSPERSRRPVRGAGSARRRCPCRACMCAAVGAAGFEPLLCACDRAGDRAV